MKKYLILSLLISKLALLECVTQEKFIIDNQDKIGVSSWEQLTKSSVYISKGGMGSVFRIPWGLDKLNNPQFAVIKEALSKDFIRTLKSEAQILHDLSVNKSISLVPQFYACVEDEEKKGIFAPADKSFYLIMEYAPYSFAHRIRVEDGNYRESEGFKKFRAMSANIRFLLYKDIFEGLMQIHKAGYAHHDIKPENLVFTTTNDITAKIIDFGVATKIEYPSNAGTTCYLDAVANQSRFHFKNRKNDIQSRKLANKFLQRKDHYKADIWALAVTIFVLEFPKALTYIKNLKLENANGADSIKFIANSIRQMNWKNKRRFNQCVGELCFGNILRRMTEYNRMPVEFDIAFRAATTSEIATIKTQLKALKPEDHITMENLFNDVNAIYLNYHEKLEQERIDYLYGNTEPDHRQKTQKELEEFQKTLNPVAPERIFGIMWDQMVPQLEEIDIVANQSDEFSNQNEQLII